MANMGCWACANGVPSPVTATLTFSGQYTIDDILGCCWECHVFSCSGHAERDADSGKWLCFSSVAKALAASAGIDDGEHVETRYASTKDFEQRLPVLAESTITRRNRWRNDNDRLYSVVMRADLNKGYAPDVLADAVGVADSLTEPRDELYNLIPDMRSHPRVSLFGGNFETLLTKLHSNG